MSADPRTPADKPVVHDTQRAAPRQAWPWVIAVAVATVVIVLVAMHFLSGVK